MLVLVISNSIKGVFGSMVDSALNLVQSSCIICFHPSVSGLLCRGGTPVRPFFITYVMSRKRKVPTSPHTKSLSCVPQDHLPRPFGLAISTVACANSAPLFSPLAVEDASEEKRSSESPASISMPPMQPLAEDSTLVEPGLDHQQTSKHTNKHKQASDAEPSSIKRKQQACMGKTALEHSWADQDVQVHGQQLEQILEDPVIGQRACDAQVSITLSAHRPEGRAAQQEAAEIVPAVGKQASEAEQLTASEDTGSRPQAEGSAAGAVVPVAGHNTLPAHYTSLPSPKYSLEPAASPEHAAASPTPVADAHAAAAEAARQAAAVAAVSIASKGAETDATIDIETDGARPDGNAKVSSLHKALCPEESSIDIMTDGTRPLQQEAEVSSPNKATRPVCEAPPLPCIAAPAAAAQQAAGTQEITGGGNSQPVAEPKHVSEMSFEELTEHIDRQLAAKQAAADLESSDSDEEGRETPFRCRFFSQS